MAVPSAVQLRSMAARLVAQSRASSDWAPHPGQVGVRVQHSAARTMSLMLCDTPAAVRKVWHAAIPPAPAAAAPP